MQAKFTDTQIISVMHLKSNNWIHENLGVSNSRLAKLHDAYVESCESSIPFDQTGMYPVAMGIILKVENGLSWDEVSEVARPAFLPDHRKGDSMGLSVPALEEKVVQEQLSAIETDDEEWPMRASELTQEDFDYLCTRGIKKSVLEKLKRMVLP